jgi:hypothetical protein
MPAGSSFPKRRTLWDMPTSAMTSTAVVRPGRRLSSPVLSTESEQAVQREPGFAPVPAQDVMSDDTAEKLAEILRE